MSTEVWKKKTKNTKCTSGWKIDSINFSPHNHNWASFWTLCSVYYVITQKPASATVGHDFCTFLMLTCNRWRVTMCSRQADSCTLVNVSVLQVSWCVAVRRPLLQEIIKAWLTEFLYLDHAHLLRLIHPSHLCHASWWLKWTSSSCLEGTRFTIFLVFHNRNKYDMFLQKIMIN